MDSSDDIKGLLADVVPVIRDTENVNTICNTMEMWKSTAAENKANWEHVKDEIRVILGERDAEAEGIEGAEAKCIEDAVNQIFAEIQSAQNQKQLASEQLEAIKSQVVKEQREAENIAKEQQAAKETSSKSLAHIRSRLNLYNSISNIRWQYDSESHEVKGFMCNKKDVHTIALSSKENSQFFITNHLWDLMDEPW